MKIWSDHSKVLDLLSFLFFLFSNLHVGNSCFHIVLGEDYNLLEAMEEVKFSISAKNSD